MNKKFEDLLKKNSQISKEELSKREEEAQTQREKILSDALKDQARKKKNKEEQFKKFEEGFTEKEDMSIKDVFRDMNLKKTLEESGNMLKESTQDF